MNRILNVGGRQGRGNPYATRRTTKSDVVLQHIVVTTARAGGKPRRGAAEVVAAFARDWRIAEYVYRFRHGLRGSARA